MNERREQNFKPVNNNQNKFQRNNNNVNNNSKPNRDGDSRNFNKGAKPGDRQAAKPDFKNRNQRCSICYKNKDKKAENSPSWKGGKTSIDRSLRNFVGSWKKSMLSKAEYKCEITGRSDEELDVHHTYPFYKIVEEVLLELNLPLKPKIHEYDKEEIDKIKSLLISKHEEYDCGFVLCKTLHLLFHKLYGKVNTSEEDLKEFIDRYNKGEFNN